MTASLEILEAARDGFNAMFKPGDTLHVRGGRKAEPVATTPLLRMMDPSDNSPASARTLAEPAFIQAGRVFVMLRKGKGNPEPVPCHRLVWPSAAKRRGGR